MSRLALKSGSPEIGTGKATGQADTGSQALTKYIQCQGVSACTDQDRPNPRERNELSILVLKASNNNAKLSLKLKSKHKYENRNFQMIQRLHAYTQRDRGQKNGPS